MDREYLVELVSTASLSIDTGMGIFESLNSTHRAIRFEVLHKTVIKGNAFPKIPRWVCCQSTSAADVISARRASGRNRHSRRRTARGGLGGDSGYPTPRPSCALPALPAFLCALSIRNLFPTSRPFRPGGDLLSVLADDMRRPNGWSDTATSRHTGHPGTGRAGGARDLGHPRPGNAYLVAATCLPIAVSGAP